MRLLSYPRATPPALEGFQRVSIDYYSLSDPLQPGPVLQSLDAVLQRASSASMTTGVAAALLDNLTAAAELPALDKETRAGFLRTLYLRARSRLLTEQPAAVRFRVADAANRKR